MLTKTHCADSNGVSFSANMTTNAIPRGEIVLRQLQSDQVQSFYIYWPISARPDAPLFVTVHGISRNAEEHAKLFSPYAEQMGVVLIAPIFPREHFPRYQRTIEREDEKQADKALLNIVTEVEQKISINSTKLYLFGFSGGGQFAHRFAMHHPQRVASYVVAAAGWYTYPDPTRKFPRGTRHDKKLFGETIDLAAYLAIPASVIVGERDIKQDAALNKNPRIIAQQGKNRLERGRRWIQAMTEAAQQLDIKPRFSFEVARSCGHSFRQSMKRGKIGAYTFAKLFNMDLKDFNVN